jgi:NTP pyrophosphatase (non-canonical NTP hydrolase)
VSFNEYQTEAASTAAFPRFYTEDQVAEMLYENGVDHTEIERVLSKFETPMSRLVYPILGLVGEAGELANKLKKWGRDSAGHSTPDQEDALADELGDTLWYVAATATSLQMDLEGVAEANLSKLFSRRDRGVIQGNGDNR